MINTLVWNCREIGDRNTRLHLMGILKEYKPGILALLETKINSKQVISFLNNIGFTDMMIVEPLGFVGGI